MRIGTLQTTFRQTPAGGYLRGYTLPELLCCLAIVAVLAASAAPAGSELISSTRQRVQTNAFRDAVQIAREAAFRSQAEITLCPYSVTNSCGHDWNQGWILIQNSVPKQTAGSTKKILVHAFNHASLSIHSNREQFSFRRSTRNTNGRVRFCRTGALSRTVVISYTGKTRVETNKQAGICG